MSDPIENGARRKEELAAIIESINENAREADSRVKATRDRALKRRFFALFSQLPPEDMAQAKQALVDGGMPVQEMEKLCEMHVDPHVRAHDG